MKWHMLCVNVRVCVNVCELSVGINSVTVCMRVVLCYIKDRTSCVAVYRTRSVRLSASVSFSLFNLIMCANENGYFPCRSSDVFE